LIEEEEEEAGQRVFPFIIKEHCTGRVDCCLWERPPAEERIQLVSVLHLMDHEGGKLNVEL
jgi:hypothetical protein